MTLNKDEQFLSSLSNIGKNLDEGKKLINTDLLIEFQSKAENLVENLEEIKNRERVLKIGIVGEVKAGKSSFLNSLIFDGESILPKAPTPMTAALTKLGYSDEPHAKIVFYTDYDWDKIENLSSEYDKQIDEYYIQEKIEAHRQQEGMMRVALPTRESVELKYKDSLPP